MVLVLLLLGIFFISSLISLLLLLSTFEIKIEKLYLDNTKKKQEKRLEREILGYIGLLLFGKWKFLSIRLDEKRLRKILEKARDKKIAMERMKQEFLENKETLALLKKIPLELEQFDLNLSLGTIDITLTTILNFVLIMLISILFPKMIKQYDANQYHYEIKPIYQNENMVKIDFHCIIHLKMVHIITILYEVLKKGRVKKNGRTSNRRSYDYSYE